MNILLFILLLQEQILRHLDNYWIPNIKMFDEYWWRMEGQISIT